MVCISSAYLQRAQQLSYRRYIPMLLSPFYLIFKISSEFAFRPLSWTDIVTIRAEVRGGSQQHHLLLLRGTLESVFVFSCSLPMLIYDMTSKIFIMWTESEATSIIFSLHLNGEKYPYVSLFFLHFIFMTETRICAVNKI